MAYEPTLDDVLNSLYGPEGGLTEEELAQYMPEPYVAPEYAPVEQGRNIARGDVKLGGPRTPYDDLIYQKAIAAGQDPNLIKAQIWAESTFNPKAVSHAGAQGLTQFMPGTWRKYGKGSPFDPNAAIDAQLAYNADLLRMFGGDERKVLAAYNWGEHRKAYALPDWERHAPAETRDYVQKILAKRDQYAGTANRSYPIATQEQSQESPFDVVKLSDGTSVDVAKGSSLADLAAALKASGIDAEPLKQVALPDGSYVDAPFSYADEDVLAGMRKQMPELFGEQPEDAKHGYGAAAKSSFEAGVGSALTGLGGLGSYAGEKLESPLARTAGEWFTEQGKEWQKMGEEAYQELTPEEASAMGFEGQFRKYVGEPVAGFVGSMGAALPALALPGGAATRIGAFAAQELGGQLEEQERMGQAPDVEKALPYAVGSGIVQNSLLGPLKYVTKAFGKPDVLAKIAEITEKKGADAAKDYAGGMMKNILAETGINTGEVVVSEVISRAAERAASGQPLDTPDAISEYEDIAIKSAPGGLLGIPGAFGVHAAKQGVIEETQLAQAQEAQNLRIAEEQKAAEEQAAVANEEQAAADAELERQAGIGVEAAPIPEPTVRGKENVAPTEPPPVAEEQLPPVEPVSAPPPVTPEIAPEAVQAAPQVKEPALPTAPTHFSDTLGIASKSGKKLDIPLKKALEQLDLENPQHQPVIAQALGEGIKLAEQGKIQLDVPKAQEIVNFIKPVEVQNAQQIPSTGEAVRSRSPQPQVRQEGQGAPVSSEGVRSGRQEIGAVKVPESKEAETVKVPESKAPEIAPPEGKTPVPVAKPDALADRITAVQDTLREVTGLLKEEQAKPKPNPALVSQYKARQRKAEQVFGNLKKQQSQQLQAKGEQRRVEAEQRAEISRAEAARKVQEQGGFEEDLIAAKKAGEKPKRLMAKGEAPKEIEVDGVKRPTTDSTGAPIHTTEEGVKNFWKGFKDTKVVDEQGKPITMYTGTSKDTDFFKFNAPKSGIWFTPDAKGASQYAVENDSMGYTQDGWKLTPKNTASRVIPTYLNLKNPKRYNNMVEAIGQVSNYKKAQGILFDKLKTEGYDGVIFGEGNDAVYVAFSPTQIKSAIGNKGAFDVSKPDIREAKGEAGVANPHTKESVQAELKKLYGENAPQIEVSDRATEKTDAATKGFFEPSTGRAVLVADNIGKGEDLHGLLRHEVAVHAKKLGKSDKEFQDILKQVDNLREQGAKDVAEAFDRVPKDTKAEDVTHEALAYLVQHKPDLPIVKRFMSWLRRTANKLTGNAKWLKGDDFAVMADAVLKKAAKEAKTEMKAGKPEERQYAKAPLVKETEADSNLKRGMNAAVKAFEGNTWTKLETAMVNKDAAMREVIKDLPLMTEDGKLRADMQASARDQIFNVISAGVTDGIPVYSTAGTVMIQKNDKLSPDSITKSIDKIKEKDPRPYFGFIQRVLRGEELKKEDAEAIKQIDILEDKAKKLKAYAKTQAFAEGKKADTLANRYLAEAKKLKDRVGEEGREKLVTDEDILEAKRRLAKHPEIQEILDNVRGLMHSLVDLAVESGWVSKEVGKEWKARPYYFPLYMSQEDILSDPSKVVRAMGGGAKSLPNVKALKGGTHAINMLENLYKHYAFMISASAQNSSRKAAARDLELFGAAQRTSPDDKNAIMFKENGKEIYYKIADPLMFEAFQAAAPLTNPLLKAAREYTKAFRAVTLVNPLYWYRQLIRDPIHANVVSQTGMVTPIGATITFAKILAGRSEEYKEIRRRGVVGAVDSLNDPARFKKVYDKGPSLFKKGADWVMHVHEAADAATRVEVYKAAMKEAKKRGMGDEKAKDYATMRAREIINFAHQGRSETLQAIRATVPFFSAALNSLDSVARAAAGKGLNRREAAEARRLFTSRMLMIASFSTAYALAMQDDEDYLKSPDSINNWLIPTGNKENPFIMIPLPFELGFVAKILPEWLVRVNSGTLTPYEGKKMLKEAAGATLTPPLPFPQVIKPIAEAAINYDLHQGRPIVSPSEQGKLPEEQTRGASALSIEIGRKLGLSPAQIEHFGRGYMTELWTAIGVLSDAFLPAGQYKEAKSISEIPTLLGGAKGILSKPDRDRDVDIFYELSNGAQQIKRSVTAAQGKGDVDAMERIMADPEKKKRFYASDVGRNIGEELSKVNTAIEQIRNDKSITDPKKKQEMIREKQQYRNKLATQGKEWLYSLGVNEP